MKKNFLRMFGIFSILCIFGLTTDVHALEIDDNEDEKIVTIVEQYDANEEINVEETIGLSSEAPIYEPFALPGDRGTSKPSATWNLATQGTYSMAGLAYTSNALYSNYNFTGVTQINTSIHVTGSNNVTVSLYRNKLLSDPLVGQFTATSGSITVGFFQNLNSSYKYYLKFSGPCEFTGTVYKNN